MRPHSAPSLRACAVVTFALLSTVATGPATALTTARELVVSGTGTQMTAFTLYSEISFDPAKATVRLGPGSTYGGAAFLAAVEPYVYTGAYRITALEDLPLPQQPPAPIRTPYQMGRGGRDRVTLHPGTYRVYLFGDGMTEYRVPLVNGMGLTLRPSEGGRSWVHTETRVLPTDSDSARDRTVLARSFSRPGNAVTELHGAFTAHGRASNVEVRICFTRTPDCAGHGGRVSRGDAALGGGAMVASGIYPDRHFRTDGRYQARAEFLSARSVGAVGVLALLQLEL